MRDIVRGTATWAALSITAALALFLLYTLVTTEAPAKEPACYVSWEGQEVCVEG